MTTIGELATKHPVQVLTTTRVGDAARFMADFGIGDVIVTDPDTGVVVGMLTDRDITVRVVARNLDAPGTEVGMICSHAPTTVMASADIAVAEELMRRDAVRRLPVVDDHGKPVGIISIEDLAASCEVADHDLRDVMRSLANSYRVNRIAPAR